MHIKELYEKVNNAVKAKGSPTLDEDAFLGCLMRFQCEGICNIDEKGDVRLCGKIKERER